MMDEIFGINNFISQVKIKANPRGRQAQSHLSIVHEYCFIYARNFTKLNLQGVKVSKKYIKEFKHTDNDGQRWRELGLRQRGAESLRKDRPDMFFPL